MRGKKSHGWVTLIVFDSEFWVNPNNEKGLGCWEKALHAEAVRAPCFYTVLSATYATYDSPERNEQVTTALTIHYFTGNNATLYLLLPSTRAHSTQGAIPRAETSSPDNKPICPGLVILWNRKINTFTTGKHQAFCDYGTNGPRWEGQANIPTTYLWVSLPCTHGMCICTHTSCTQYTWICTYIPASCGWVVIVKVNGCYCISLKLFLDWSGGSGHLWTPSPRPSTWSVQRIVMYHSLANILDCSPAKDM